MQIKKSSGIAEPFNEQKLYQSIRSAGLEHSLAEEVTRMVVQDKNNLVSTHNLHRQTTKVLVQQQQLAAAARYNLKRAIMALGPTGYPFEQFIARVFNAHGYTTLTNQIVRGRCVSHEIDIIAQRDNYNYLVECKHHQFSGSKTDVKVMLYIQARFLDIQQALKKFDKPWVVTNTKATSDALQYAQCNDMLVLAWHYPHGRGLNHLIEDKNLYPITVLPQLTHQEATILLRNNFVIIDQLVNLKEDDLVHSTGIRRDAIAAIQRLARELL